jgi:hypothetical protein
LTEAFRDGLIEASHFDWGSISPAIFGSMFQVVQDQRARRAGGEHYTSEENILNTIEPLFLDDHRQKLQVASDDKGRLTELHNELGQVRLLDRFIMRNIDVSRDIDTPSEGCAGWWADVVARSGGGPSGDWGARLGVPPPQRLVAYLIPTTIESGPTRCST